MERPAPVRKSHTSTADLLAWPHQADGPATPSPARRPHQPSEAIRKVVFGGQVTEEEAESLNKRKPCSAPKWKEVTGSGIFAAGANSDAEESGTAPAAATPGRAASRNYQAISTVSHISFAEDGSIPPKKPTSVAEVAKQRELSGTLSEADSKMNRQISNAKSKELTGHDIFADPPDPRPSRARNSENGSSATHTPVKSANVSNFSFGEANTDSVSKTAKKITTTKFTDLTGNNIFKVDETPVSAEKHLSSAKLKEMTGSDIFADGKAPAREYRGRTRKPPVCISTLNAKTEKRGDDTSVARGEDVGGVREKVGSAREKADGRWCVGENRRGAARCRNRAGGSEVREPTGAGGGEVREWAAVRAANAEKCGNEALSIRGGRLGLGQHPCVRYGPA